MGKDRGAVFFMGKQVAWPPFVLLPGDKELVQEVLFDAVVTAPLEAYWTALALNLSEYVGVGWDSRKGKLPA